MSLQDWFSTFVVDVLLNFGVEWVGPLFSQGKSLKNLGGQACQICGDNVGMTVDGEPFTACDICAFPVCRPCYEYERKDGNQSCPQCKTKYKRHKG